MIIVESDMNVVRFSGEDSHAVGHFVDLFKSQGLEPIQDDPRLGGFRHVAVDARPWLERSCRVAS